MADIHQRLQSLETLGIKFGLENIRRLLNALGNPHLHYPSVLIAGTNGKGSVGAMLEAILIRNGYRTGYYLSPHLVDVRERIRIQSEKISGPDFERILTRVFEVSDNLGITPTYFETMTAAGLLHFKEAQVNCAVVEVGLGGRFDATNAISQSLSIITSIGLDHEKYLGKTIEGIAVEKAMITKPGVPMVVGNVPAEALRAINDVCSSTGNSVHLIGDYEIQDSQLANGFPTFFYPRWGRPIRVNLRGLHQIQNARIALLATEILQQNGWNLSEDLTIEALGEVRWPGRLDMVPGLTPPMLFDCAHNPMGIRALVEYLDHVGWQKCVFLFTAMKDKNVEEMLALIAHRCASLVLCRVDPLERCATQQQLGDAASKAGISWTFNSDAAEALRIAEKISADSKVPAVACGSIYLIGKLFSILNLAT